MGLDSSFGKIQAVMDTMNPLDFARLRARYGGRYIALWRGKVIASAATNAALLKKIRPVMMTKRLTLMCVPPKGMACAY